MTRPCTDICKLRAPRVDAAKSVGSIAQPFGAVTHPKPAAGCSSSGKIC